MPQYVMTLEEGDFGDFDYNQHKLKFSEKSARFKLVVGKKARVHILDWDKNDDIEVRVGKGRRRTNCTYDWGKVGKEVRRVGRRAGRKEVRKNLDGAGCTGDISLFHLDMILLE